MKKSPILTVMLALIFSASLFAQETTSLPKVAFEDVLVFRLQSKSLFLSDLKTYTESLKSFQCLYPDSHMLKLTQVDTEQMNKILQMPITEAPAQKDLLNRYRRLLTLQILNNAQTFSVPRGFDTALDRRRCGVGRFQSWDNELKSLVQAELVLRESSPQMTSTEKSALLNSLDQALDFENFL